jgi:2-haloacid dehalogenase/putative hydrolase of the HAD superfamily
MAEDSFEIITFDCYGTLIDWEDGIAGAFQAAAARDGRSFGKDEIVNAYMEAEPVVESQTYRSYRAVQTEVAMRVAARLNWPLTEDRAGFITDSLPDWRPFVDTNGALERLATKFKLGLLSNIDDELLAATRKHFTVNFDLIVTAQQVQSYKPGHAHFNECRARIGDMRWLHAAQSYFHDVVPTRALGIPVAWVNRKAERVPDGGAQPTYQAPTLAALADLLKV